MTKRTLTNYVHMYALNTLAGPWALGIQCTYQATPSCITYVYMMSKQSSRDINLILQGLK